MITDPRSPLYRRFDALLYVLRLQRGRVSLKNLRAILRRRGLDTGGKGRELLLRLYEDEKHG